MTEDFLHYIWQCGLFYPLKIDKPVAETIEVLSSGELNINAGPDFFNAVIRLGDTVFAGNVEIHICSSDWYKHGHHQNRSYDNVILQLVLRNDAEVKRTTGEVIPTAELRFSKRLLDNYCRMLRNQLWIPCQSSIAGADELLVREWIDRLAAQRLEQKSLILRDIFHSSLNSWEDTFYQQLARNFGFRLNGGVFEMLARSLPYRLIMRHRDNLFQLEAMLFGQAGMLSDEAVISRDKTYDSYYESLKNEYFFLKRKYNLKPLEKHLWRFLRLRPANFPTIRLAQFAALLHEKSPLFAVVLDCRDIGTLTDIFRISGSGYWDTRFLFNRTSARCRKNLGVFAVRSLIINTVVPVLWFYGRQRGVPELFNRANGFLRELPPENNSVIKKWGQLGLKAKNALQSQGLMQLRNEYCSYRRCLECSIGKHIITI